jgi:hypothetical protein
VCIIQGYWYGVIFLTIAGTAILLCSYKLPGTLSDFGLGVIFLTIAGTAILLAACSYKLPGTLSDFGLIVRPETFTPSSTVTFFVLIDTDESISSPEGYIASEGQIAPLTFTGKLGKGEILAGKEVYIVVTCSISGTKKTKSVVIHGE